MSQVKILVVEDEIIIADNICFKLEELGYSVFEPAINYTEALELIKEEQPDLAILDIQLSGAKSGIDIARKIEKEFHFPFIFLTSNADPATINEAKLVRPSAYLIKPFTGEELHSAIEVALFNYACEKKEQNEKGTLFKDSIFLKEKGQYRKIEIKNILYLKSSHVYVEVFLKNEKKIVVRNSLNEVQKKLPPNFLRVHRSFIINAEHLEQINSFSLKMNRETIPIGKSYYQDLISKINAL